MDTVIGTYKYHIVPLLPSRLCWEVSAYEDSDRKTKIFIDGPYLAIAIGYEFEVHSWKGRVREWFMPSKKENGLPIRHGHAPDAPYDYHIGFTRTPSMVAILETNVQGGETWLDRDQVAFSMEMAEFMVQELVGSNPGMEVVPYEPSRFLQVKP